MLIERLVEYAHNTPEVARQLEDPLFEEKAVRWELVVGDGGESRGLSQLGDGKRGLPLIVPKKIGGNAGGVATFATDNPRFVLGYSAKDDAADKIARDHPAFIELINQAAEADPDPAFLAAREFYARPDQVEAARRECSEKKVADGDRIALAYRRGPGEIDRLFEMPASKAFWRAYQAARTPARPAGAQDAVQCLSCGEEHPAVRTNDTKIMGVLGGQPSGTALVSFDKDAFQSFGWDKNANAAVCEPCSQAYTRALNHLLSPGNMPRTRVNVAGGVYVSWSSPGAPGELLSILDEPDSERAAEALRVFTSPQSGHLPLSAPDARVFALGLRGNGGRAVVTDWFDTSLETAYDNLVHWYEDLQIRLLVPEREKGMVLREAGQLSRKPRLSVLCRATARDDDGISPRLPGQLLRAALRGDPIPVTAVQSAVARFSVDGFGDYFAPARLGLVRCALNRMNPGGTQLMPGLDLENHDPAYLSGRLLATLDAVQYTAVGAVGANVVDRYYGRASTAPGLVFGQLLTLSQSHLGTIRSRGNRGAYMRLDNELQEIISHLDGQFPQTLSPEDQGRFAIGFYHQRAQRFADIREHQAREEQSADANDN